MAILFSTWYLDILTVFATLFLIVTWYMNNNFDYWKKRGVHYIKPFPYFGNYKDVFLLKKNLGVFLLEMHKKLEGHKFGGLFQLREPILMVRDTEIIKNILVRDFVVLPDRGLFSGNSDNPLSRHLFTLDHKQWKWLRNKLSPTFTGARMKGMFSLMVDVAENLAAEVARRTDSGNCEIEFKDMAARYSIDVIGSCVFGIECNCLSKPDSEFREMGLLALGGSTASFFRQLVVFLLPNLSKALRIKDIDPKVEEFFLQLVRDTVNYRIKNGTTRNDFLQLLINLRHESNSSMETTVTANKDLYDGEKQDMDDAMMAAQCFSFFFAGFDTSSSTVSFFLYELALQPDLQQQVREEIDAVLGDSATPTYENLSQMKLLDRCVSETLRKHPIGSTLFRITRAPYTIPDTDITLQPGTRVIISALGLHKDPKCYPDPEKFDPERFSEEEKAQRPSFMYLPFGEGPRSCIGNRFALQQMKVALVILLSRFEFSVCTKTPVPVDYEILAGLLEPKGGMWLGVRRRRKPDRT